MINWTKAHIVYLSSGLNKAAFQRTRSMSFSRPTMPCRTSGCCTISSAESRANGYVRSTLELQVDPGR